MAYFETPPEAVYRDPQVQMLSAEKERAFTVVARSEHSTVEERLEAKHRVIEGCVPLVHHVVGRIVSERITRGIPTYDETYDDMLAEGYRALVTAFDSFDPDKGRFAGYAKRVVRQAAYRHLREEQKQIEVTRKTERGLRDVLNHKTFEEERTGRPVSLQAACEAVGVDFHELQAMLHARDIVRLEYSTALEGVDAEDEAGNATTTEFIAARPESDAAFTAEDLAQMQALNPALTAVLPDPYARTYVSEEFEAWVLDRIAAAGLSEKERDVLCIHHGLGGITAENHTEGARELGIPRKTYTDALGRAERKLREAFISDGMESVDAALDRAKEEMDQ